MFSKKIHLLVSTLFMALMLTPALAHETETPLPIDPEVTIGTLDNGLTFYIRHNEKPEKRVSLRLVVRVGSLHEDEDQQGLAHFLEHMAFNGTKHFEKQQLVDYLEKIGTRFGADLNASTSFEETLYKLQVPTDDDEILQQAFLILQDWASAVTFDAEEIEKERGVVIEEWRGSRGARARISDKQFPILFHESRYAKRLPIGKVDILENAPQAAFQRFFRDWYRPDLMAVIVVGDVEVSWARKMIETYFAGLKNPEQPRPHQYYALPAHAETLYSINSDPELTRSTIEIYYKHPVSKMTSVEGFRQSLVRKLNQGILNNRLRERTRDGNPPYLMAYSSYGHFTAMADAFTQATMVKEGAFEEALLALLGEGHRVIRFGFTATELEREKKDMLRRLERAAKESDKTESRSFVSSYMNHFLTDQPIPGIANTLKYSQQFLPTISLDEVNKLSGSWITAGNQVILVSTPVKEGLKPPSETEISQLIQQASKQEVKAYQDEVSDDPLLAKHPKPGNVKQEKHIEELGVWEWKLANGARVLLKPSDFKNDEILFSAYSNGGSSLVDAADYVAAITADMLVDESGLGAFGPIELEKKLAGKALSISPYIAELQEGFSGSASPRDVETMLQLLYLYFTEPRIGARAYESTVTRIRSFVENRDANPSVVFRDEINKVLYRNHPRKQPFTLATLDLMNKDKSIEIYKQRFHGASDFTFVFVGNFEVEQFKPLVETYIGGLPATKKVEQWQDIGLQFARGHQQVKVNKGLEPKASVRIIYSGESTWSPKQRHLLLTLNSILSIRLREILREDMGGVYGVRVSGRLTRWPKEHYVSTVSFNCDPNSTDALIKATKDELARAMADGFEQSYLDKVKETQQRGYEVNTRRNDFWLRNLEYYHQNQLDPREILSYPERVSALKLEEINTALATYFNDSNHLLAVLHPQEEAAEK